ncbi:hypothetical protein BDV93DRAFT_566740 [Ceratobasidium sp. AG-I]|nr:hypothetical protein BDV93DRAFT_566868 [Ceratobasidium sp. AG-I]KAF8593256.1 hypothetical protein BDV93DRAFT_566740 [Ceratobasidium sp. AG-I]
MSPHVLRLFFALVPLVTLLAQQALPASAVVLQERQSQEPTLPSNLTQDVLQVGSAISPPCANTDSCISLVTDVIPACEKLGGDPGCWCANHDALHNCAMCMISPTDNQTTTDQTEAAAAGHSDPEVWNPKNIRPDGTTLIVHSNKDLASGLGKKITISWSLAIIGIRLDFNPMTWDLMGSIGVKIPFFPYRPVVGVSGNLRQALTRAWNKFLVIGSATFHIIQREVWVRLVVTSRWLNVNKPFLLIRFCKIKL